MIHLIFALIVGGIIFAGKLLVIGALILILADLNSEKPADKM